MRRIADERQPFARRSSARSDASWGRIRARPRCAWRRGASAPRRSISRASASSSSPSRRRASSCRITQTRLDRLGAVADGGQRNEGERPAAGVELGREVVVRQSMGEMRRQCGLRIAMDARFEPRGAARPRTPGRRRRSRAGPRSRVRLRASPGRRRRKNRKPPPPRRRARRRDSRATLTASASAIRSFSIFQPKASSPISAAWNSTGRGGKNAPVPSMRRNERRGEARDCKSAHRPRDLKKRDGLVEQGDRASPPGPLGGAAADDVEPRLRQAERRGQPGEPRARRSGRRAARAAVSSPLVIFGLRSRLCDPRWLSFAIGETASCNFDKAEAIRSSRRRTHKRVAREAGGAGHVDRKATR